MEEIGERPEDAMDPAMAARSRPRQLSEFELRQIKGRAAKSRALYVALGIFFGMAGAHNFYAGRYVAAVCQLGLLLTVGWWLPLVLIPLTAWVILELIVVEP